MSRDLSNGEKQLLYSKVPKALGQGRKSYETKLEANAVLHKAGYKPYFSTDHKDKKAKLNITGTSTGTSAGTCAGAGIGTSIIISKPILKSIKDLSPINEPNNQKVCLCNSHNLKI
jgi:hypothetical protein